MKRNGLILMLIATLLPGLVSCSTAQVAGDSSAGVVSTAASPAPAATPAADEEITRPQGWGEETHSKDATPNYDVVFPQDKVNQITITIDPEDWEAMQANMTELYGERGTRMGQGGPGAGGAPPGGGGPDAGGAALPQGGEPPQQGERPEGGAPFAGGPGGGGPGFGGPGFGRENPMWVPATIEFEGHTWTNVGVRYKGNSSLMSSWNGTSLKLPLKLDFDEFEDEHPEIKDQRFYGFKQLSLANGFGDNSYMREAVAYDLLEEAGLVAAETAYYEVTLDYGEGPVNLGLYVVIEVVDDTVIGRYFDDDSGNIYEAEGAAASLAEGTFDQIKDSFQKENNEQEADWSDIEALYNVLHSEERTTDPQAWRAKLESLFDVDAFLEWLAIGAVIQHWDAYGSMTHNYYLYHDPGSGRLAWISWDHNQVLGGMGGPGGRREQPAAEGAEAKEPPAGMEEPGVRVGGPGGQMGGPGGGRNTSLDKANVGDNWPLIRYLLDDPTYYERYISYLEETSSGLFDPDKLAQKYQQLAELIAPYAAEEEGKDAFEAAVQELTERTYDRAQAVSEFLATQSSGTE
jgi:spore coat protein H